MTHSSWGRRFCRKCRRASRRAGGDLSNGVGRDLGALDKTPASLSIGKAFELSWPSLIIGEAFELARVPALVADPPTPAGVTPETTVVAAVAIEAISRWTLFNSSSS